MNAFLWTNHDKLILIFVIIKIFTFYFSGLYKGLWKYASISDMVNVLKATILSTRYDYSNNLFL